MLLTVCSLRLSPPPRLRLVTAFGRGLVFARDNCRHTALTDLDSRTRTHTCTRTHKHTARTHALRKISFIFLIIIE